MSGGAWGYLSYKLDEYSDRVSDVMEFVSLVEHELDWGVSGDTCQACAEKRVMAAIYQFFEDRAYFTDEVKETLVNHDNEETMCERHIEWKNSQLKKALEEL